METPFERKSCYDCGFLKSALSWWCINEQAIKYRGTSLPGCIHCPYWKPDWEMIPKKYRTEENGYKTFWEKLTLRVDQFRKLISKYIKSLYR